MTDPGASLPEMALHFMRTLAKNQFGATVIEAPFLEPADGVTALYAVAGGGVTMVTVDFGGKPDEQWVMSLTTVMTIGDLDYQQSLLWLNEMNEQLLVGRYFTKRSRGDGIPGIVYQDTIWGGLFAELFEHMGSPTQRVGSWAAILLEAHVIRAGRESLDAVARCGGRRLGTGQRDLLTLFQLSF
jgi:hypothetical protein